MKKIALLFLLSFSLLTFSLNASVVTPVDPVSKEKAYEQKVALLKRISTMSVKEFEAYTGKHMNFFDRQIFKIQQRKLKNSIDEEGNITNKRLDKYLKKSTGDGATGFHLGGFALGILLSLIGVLIAYVAFEDRNKTNRIKWAWIGCAISILVFGLAFGIL